MTQAILNNTLNNFEKTAFKKDYSNKSYTDNSKNFEQIFSNTQQSQPKQTETVQKKDKDYDTSKSIDKSKNDNYTSDKKDISNLTNSDINTTEENSEEKISTSDQLIESIENIISNTDIENSDETDTNTESESESETTTNQSGEELLDINNSNLLENITNTIQTIIPNSSISEKNNCDTSVETNSSNDETDNDLDVTINGESLDITLKNFGIDSTSDETTSSQITNLTKKDTSIKDTDAEALEEIIDEDTLKDLKIESIEIETGDSSNNNSSDLMQNQTPEEQGIKAMMNIDGDFADIKVDTVKNTTNNQISKPSSPTELGPSKIIEQISKQLEGLNNSSKVNIVLNPESLGKVSVQLINTKEGLSAQFTVATQDARNLIMKGLDGLKDTLMAHGVSVDNVTVKMNETQESGYQADWTEQEGSRGGNKEQNPNREHKEQQKFDEMMSNIDNNENGKI